VGTTHDRQRASRNVFLQHLDGLVFGDDPRHGYIEGPVFRHPVRDYSLERPVGWSIWIGPRVVLFTSPDQSMQIQVTEDRSRGLHPADYVRRLAYDLRIRGYSPAQIHLVQPVRASDLLVPQAWPTGYYPLQVFVFQNRMGGPFLRLVLAHSRVYGPQPMPFPRISAWCDRVTQGPSRIAIIQAPRHCTLSEIPTLLDSVSMNLPTLALLNGLHSNAWLPAGTLLKIVTASDETPPRTAMF
jgi:predicted Zn-dependent protease